MPAPVSNTNGLCNGEAKEARHFVFRNLHYLPITAFVCSLLAMFVPYAISVYLGDTPAILPFISCNRDVHEVPDGVAAEPTHP